MLLLKSVITVSKKREEKDGVGAMENHLEAEIVQFTYISYFLYGIYYPKR